VRPHLPLLAAAGAAAGALAWGAFESTWVELVERECPVPDLRPELEGLRVAHLSDFHFGLPSLGRLAGERAVEWTAAREPDLVGLTGDLVSRPAGLASLRELVARLPRCYAALGNHDFAISRDPLAKRTAPEDLSPATLLLDEGATVELRGRRVQVVGVDPRSYQWRRTNPAKLADPAADLRILLCHFPGVVDRLPPGVFHLVLAGHLHGGQICVPYPGGKLRLAHPDARYTEGLYRRPAATLHVSRGLGTTFVPFRFFARPEATELVLHRA